MAVEGRSHGWAPPRRPDCRAFDPKLTERGAGRSEEALAGLQEYGRRFPEGKLSQEAALLERRAALALRRSSQ